MPKHHDIEVTHTDLYYIGKGYVENLDKKATDPAKLILMLPIKQGEDDISKAFRFLLYQYENYWAIYSVGAIAKMTLSVDYQNCFYDRIGIRGYNCANAIENISEYLQNRHFYREEDVVKAIYGCGNPEVRTFVSYVDRSMTEQSIKKAWMAARIISNASRPSEMSSKIDFRVAEIYTQCKKAADEEHNSFQPCKIHAIKEVKFSEERCDHSEHQTHPGGEIYHPYD